MEMNIVEGKITAPAGVCVSGSGTFESAFDVSGLAVSSMAAAANAAAALSQKLGNPSVRVSIDRNLAAAWFSQSFVPEGWEIPSPWDAIAGDYQCADGWIRLHTNAPHHKAAALGVLGLAIDSTREDVAKAVKRWHGEELETAVVTANGCAALMRSGAEWSAHPQGQALAAEPLVQWGSERQVGKYDVGTPARPLLGVKVLDLTRVIAGPVATRFLAYLGADVLRIDPPWWEESALEAEMTAGKHCARLELTKAGDRDQFEQLLATADILVQGYRSDALENLGFGEGKLALQHPELVVVELDAYGWHGPWSQRRGFDSLVQMSCGIAQTGMQYFGKDKPTPLPVQALDHATGYLTAAAALAAWTDRLDGTARNAKLSLARTAVDLMKTEPCAGTIQTPTTDQSHYEETLWGPGRRLNSAITIDGVELFTDVQARGFGTAQAEWVQA